MKTKPIQDLVSQVSPSLHIVQLRVSQLVPISYRRERLLLAEQDTKLSPSLCGFWVPMMVSPASTFSQNSQNQTALSLLAQLAVFLSNHPCEKHSLLCKFSVCFQSPVKYYFLLQLLTGSFGGSGYVWCLMGGGSMGWRGVEWDKPVTEFRTLYRLTEHSATEVSLGPFLFVFWHKASLSCLAGLRLNVLFKRLWIYNKEETHCPSCI